MIVDAVNVIYQYSYDLPVPASSGKRRSRRRDVRE